MGKGTIMIRVKHEKFHDLRSKKKTIHTTIWINDIQNIKLRKSVHTRKKYLYFIEFENGVVYSY